MSLGVVSTGERPDDLSAASDATAGRPPDPLSLCLNGDPVFVPEVVVTEPREIASYDDVHAHAANAVLDRTDASTVQSVALDASFPLDDGENAGVTLANEIDADLFCCDEFSRLGLIHASLADTRLVTTPTLLSPLVRADRLTTAEARALLDDIGDARSWHSNAYVDCARALFEVSRDRLSRDGLGAWLFTKSDSSACCIAIHGQRTPASAFICRR